jgi:hypothetical protein
MVKKISFFGTVLAGLLCVPAAFAGSGPVTTGYGGVAGQVTSKIKPSAAGTHVSGTLPFTGTNLALFVAAAVILLALGLGFRRVSRRPNGLS